MSDTLNGDDVELTTTYAYDAIGNLKSVEQPNGVTTSYNYDELNHLVHRGPLWGRESLMNNFDLCIKDSRPVFSIRWRTRVKMLAGRWLVCSGYPESSLAS